MPMRMMGIGEMRVLVRHGLVPVAMRVRDAGRWRHRVLMLVVGVVDMFMLMLHRFVNVLVNVVLAQVQPDAERHQRPGQ